MLKDTGHLAGAWTAIGAAFVLVFSVFLSIPIQAASSSANNEEWKTSLVVGTYHPVPGTYSDEPDQIFKVYYRVLNGTIDKVGREQVQVSSNNGNGTLEIKFPRNYPYTNEDASIAPISVRPMVIFEAEPYDEMIDITYSHLTDCFFVFSIPFTYNKTIGLVWTYLLWEKPAHGDTIPDSCISQTMIDNVPTKKDGTISPLQQVKAGIAPRDVLCSSPNNMLIISMSDKPYCAPENIVTKLRKIWQNNGAECFEAVKYVRWECSFQ